MKLKPLTDLEWVALARFGDPFRPVLQGIHVRADRVEATDSHRLHMVTGAIQRELTTPGVFSYRKPALGDPIEGKFPITDQVIPACDWKPQQVESHHLVKVRALCRAGMAANRELGQKTWFVGLTAKDGGRTVLDPSFVYDITRMTETFPIYVWAEASLKPLRWQIGEADGTKLAWRTAVLMPVRALVENGPQKILDLDPYVETA